MQISDKVYLEIKVKGSDREGIVTFDMFQRFEMVETAGASLPYICFSFATFDKSLADLFIENNEVTVSIGETKENSDTFILHSVVNLKDTDPSNNSWTVYYGGFIGKRNDFMMNKAVCQAYPGNSLMVIDQLIQNGLTMNTDIETTNENQVLWRQLYTTTNAFLVDTALHMDIRPSFPVFSFDRYGNFNLRDFNKMRRNGPQVIFTPGPPKSAKEIQYLNNFNTESFKTSYNLYSGYQKMTEAYKTSKGVWDYSFADNVPILASSQESEKLDSGSRVSLNKIQSDSVHDTYMAAFAHNTNCLMSLSSMLGCVRLAGYYRHMKPTDLAYVVMDGDSQSDRTLEGYYLIDTIVTVVECEGGVPKMISTFVYVTRDNKNNVENFVTEKKERMKVTKKLMQSLANAVSRARRALATCAQIMDGTFIRACANFLTASKVNILRMFSMSGIMIDFTSQANFLRSLLFQGNALMNILMNMIFPKSIALMLQNVLLEKPSKRTLVSKYIGENVPFEIQGLVSDLVDALMGVHDTLNSIAEDNSIKPRENPLVVKDNSSYNEEENRLNQIFEEFERNTTGLDVPFPIMELTDSQKLLPMNELRDLVAKETIANLTDLGYMEGVDTKTFEDILEGKTPIDFDIINQINNNAGYSFNFRYWGTYGPSNDSLYAWEVEGNLVYTKSAELSIYSRLYNNDASPYMGSNFKLVEEDGKYFITFTDILGEVKVAERNEEEDVNSDALAQLTEYYITKGYKDKYRTIPCTKLISALRNSRLYFACPQTEENLRFYINSKRVLLKSFPIDLGFRDLSGRKILYTVYYTETGYNSNSTMLEVRQG